MNKNRLSKIFKGDASCMLNKIEKYLDRLELAYEQINDDYFTYQRRRLQLSHTGSNSIKYKSFDINEYTQYRSQVTDIETEIQNLISQSETHLMYLVDKQMLKIRLSKMKVFLKDERLHHLYQVSMMMRSEFRCIFGIKRSHRCGDFLDKHMSGIIHEYAYDISAAADINSNSNHECLLIVTHPTKILSVAVSSDGRYVFSGGYDCITIGDLKTNQALNTQLNAHSGAVTSLAYHSGYLASGGGDTTINIWDAYSLKVVRTMRGHVGTVNSVSFNSTGDRLISGSADKSLREWSLLTGQCLRVFVGHKHSVLSARFIDDGSVISGSYDASIKVWHPLTTRNYCSITDGIVGAVRDVDINSDSSMLVCVSQDSSVTVFDLPNLHVVCHIHRRSVKACFHPFIPYVLAVAESFTRSVKVYDVVSGHCIRMLNGHSGVINDLCFSPDGSRLVSVSSDRSTQVWNASFLFETRSVQMVDPIDFLFFG